MVSVFYLENLFLNYSQYNIKKTIFIKKYVITLFLNIYNILFFYFLYEITKILEYRTVFI